MGTFHQGNKIFRNAGSQCSAIAYFAILVFYLCSIGMINSNISGFNSTTADLIVSEGNKLYENIIDEHGFQQGHFLAHDELPSSFTTGIGEIQTTVYPDMLYGIVGQDIYDHGVGAVSLMDAINTGFQISDFLICTFNDLTIAFFQSDDNYFVFDSHSRDMHGNFAEYGSSILLEFLDISSVTSYLSTMYSGSFFNFSPVMLFSQSEERRDQNEIPKNKKNNSDCCWSSENHLKQSEYWKKNTVKN